MSDNRKFKASIKRTVSINNGSFEGRKSIECARMETPLGLKEETVKMTALVKFKKIEDAKKVDFRVAIDSPDVNPRVETERKQVLTKDPPQFTYSQVY